jgi:hypothetical protein
MSLLYHGQPFLGILNGKHITNIIVIHFSGALNGNHKTNVFYLQSFPKIQNYNFGNDVIFHIFNC